jgi:outer membrane protein assembly factor BamA
MRSAFILVWLQLWAICFATSQLAPREPQAAYEGQNVSSVSLVANPHRDLNPLLSVLTQKAGEPYSQKKIDESREALQQAGHFDKVQIDVVPEIHGLQVNFILEPAWYLGVLDFPGATKNFSYARLLQVVNLQDEDPYDPARIAAAANELLQFLKRNGYFLSTVHPETQIDDDHQIVNVTFVVNLGKQARIGSVTVEGPSEPEAAHLVRSLRSMRAQLSGGLLKSGKPYSAPRIEAATALMKKTLARQRRLASHVQENPPEFCPETNRVNVSFKVEVGPVVTVKVTGARLTRIPFMAGREMMKLIPVYSEGTIDRDLVDEGQRNLTDFFQKQGYYDVKVSTAFQHQPNQILVSYSIDRGKKHKVEHIGFRGNHQISEKELMAQVTIKKSHLWTHGSISQKLLKQSAANIEALYRDRGHEDVKVTPQAIDHEPKIDIDFDIEEGAQTVVDGVEVTGNQNIPYEQLTVPAGFQLRSGTPFSPRKLAEDRNRISATYLNRGYLNAEVKASINQSRTDPHRVNVSYAIAEGQLVRLSDVVYLGQRRTRLSLIKKTAQIPPETPMRRGQMLEAESRLYDLNIFDWSSVGPRKPITNQTDEEALVKVHEAKRNEITYGFGFEVSHRGGNVPGGTVAIPGGGPTIGLGSNQIAPSQSTFASPRGSIEFNRRNMRGLGETAGASLLLSRLDQRVLMTYTQPHFVGSQWGSLTSFSLERNSENPLFTASLGDLSFQVERLISRKHNTRLQVRYDFNKTALSHLLVPDLVLEQDRNVRLSTFSGTLIHDTRDKPLDAHRGMFSTLDLAITPTAFGSSANFTKLFGQYAFYKPVGPVVFANSIRLGLAKAFAGSFVPTSQLFFSGGGTSLRSFPIDQAGPQRLVPFCNVLQGQSGCVNVTVPVGGRQLFILNSELRFPLRLMKALGGVVFYDGGNVYRAINFNDFANNYTNTIGFGLRYATPIGPVRIDIGHNLNPVPGIKSTQYYITVGQAF